MAKLHGPAYAAKFMRPKLAKHVIERPAMLEKLRETLEYPLTIVRGGAGYGKTTLINQALPEEYVQTVWITLDEEVGSAASFLQHLIYALMRSFPGLGEPALQMLAWEERPAQATDALAALADELRQDHAAELVIILDDFQYVSHNPAVLELVNTAVDIFPAAVHIVIASRERVPLPGLLMKHAKGLLLEINEADLAFKTPEIQLLFQKHYAVPVDDGLAEQLISRTEGWIMAIHMLGQIMRKGQSLTEALSSWPQSMTELFEYLLQDYLAKQPEKVREFLKYTAFLEILRAEDCDKLLEINNSSAILNLFEAKGLFTFHMGEGLYRYHRLFREHLQKTSRITGSSLDEFHRRAATHYLRQEDYHRAILHMMEGRAYPEAAELIKRIVPDAMGGSRQEELKKWLDRLPAEVIRDVPELLLCRGDMHRLSGDFTTALTLYRAAAKGFAATANPTGQYLVTKAFALVYLDTVQPVLAEQYLMQALALVDRSGIQEKARLYQLLAENYVNMGRSDQAAGYFRQANELFLEDSRGDVEARMHLRTGRLHAAKSILQKQAQQRSPYQPPRSHRETPLLLSLLNAFLGEIDEAWVNAQEGLLIGVRRKAVFVEAVAHMRLGHAKQLKSWTDMNEAVESYQQALRIVSELAVERGKAEPLFGLCLLYGHRGQLDVAIRYGLEGLEVGQRSKDEWISAMIELAITIAYYKSGVLDQAGEWAVRSHNSFIRCGDSYLSTVAMFWQARIAYESGEKALFRQVMEGVLLRAQSNSLDFIFCKPTLLGLRDTQGAMPILLAAEKENICHAYTASLLAELGSPGELASHPGYTLRVQTLGQFKAWRGMAEIRPKEWQREKAKRLFQYLVTRRKQLIHKEQLLEQLWGDSGSDNDFKVALNAMTNALEPSRSARSAPFYLLKHDSSYGLNLAAGIMLDADEFESYISRGYRIAAKDPEQAIRLFRLALNLYKGDFLPECCYEDWCQEERERLLMLYITTAERMAYLLFERGEIEECITLCMRILGKDCCWEAAYRILMQCYYRQNNRAMVIRVFRQCRDNLKKELGVTPATETIAMYKQLATAIEKM